jgi:hypothetical protein
VTVVKKLLSVLLVCAMAMSVAGCGSSAIGEVSDLTSSDLTSNKESETMNQENTLTSKSTAESEYYTNLKNEYDAVLGKLSTSSYEQLLTITLPSAQLFSDYLMYMFSPFPSHQVTPIEFSAKYKIECLREMNKGRMYSIQKTDSGGLFYSFFVSGDEDISEGAWLYHTVFVVKNLKKSDFSSIKNGDDISVAESVDPALTHWKQRAIKANMSSFQSKHLLNDGLLVINFQKTSEQSFQVEKIEYHKDFTCEIVSSFGTEKYDYSILSQDYPK